MTVPTEAMHDDVLDPELLERARALGQDAARFPVVVTSGRMLGAMYSIPLEQAWALLPATERLVPVRTTPRRAAIAFMAWEVSRSDLGPYHELVVALPVLLDVAKPPVPLHPARWRDPSLGIHVVEMPVDSERCLDHGTGLLGLPHVLGDLDVDLDQTGGRATFDYEGERMAELRVDLGRWPRERRHDLGVQAYSLLEGRIVRTRHSGVGVGYRGRRGSAALAFGEHRRAQRLARLSLSRRPLELRVLPRLNQVTWGPEDLGPA